MNNCETRLTEFKRKVVRIKIKCTVIQLRNLNYDKCKIFFNYPGNISLKTWSHSRNHISKNYVRCMKCYILISMWKKLHKYLSTRLNRMQDIL